MAENFEKLECWRVCNELKIFLRNEILPKLPKTERYELYSQILRASRSATANIAEGWGRYHFKENIKFLLNARGSVGSFLELHIRRNPYGDQRQNRFLHQTFKWVYQIS